MLCMGEEGFHFIDLRFGGLAADLVDLTQDGGIAFCAVDGKLFRGTDHKNLPCAFLAGNIVQGVVIFLLPGGDGFCKFGDIWSIPRRKKPDKDIDLKIFAWYNRKKLALGNYFTGGIIMGQIYLETQAVMEELVEKAKIKPGQIVVVGCSTSEVLGAKIGTNSNPETAKDIFAALYDCAWVHGFHLAIQCCEHLNRAIIVDRAAVPGGEIVNVVPQPKAGGSLATAAYAGFENPVAVEQIAADAGLDIGLTLIGMHLKKVAVPVRLEHNRIGEAFVVAARTRPKFIGGVRAVYDEELL